MIGKFPHMIKCKNNLLCVKGIWRTLTFCNRREICRCHEPSVFSDMWVEKSITGTCYFTEGHIAHLSTPFQVIWSLCFGDVFLYSIYIPKNTLRKKCDSLVLYNSALKQQAFIIQFSTISCICQVRTWQWSKSWALWLHTPLMV